MKIYQNASCIISSSNSHNLWDMMIKNIYFGNTDFRLILTKSFDEETLLGDYFYSSVLSTTLNHTVREIIKAYKDGMLDDKIMQMQYKDSLQTFNVPIKD